jgi:hypothetical protein
MFKDIQRGFEKFFTTQRVIVLIIFIVIAWALLSYSGSKGSVHDLMSTGHPGASGPSVPGASLSSESGPAPPASSSSPSGPAGKGYALQPVANPADLLPQDQNSQWSALNPNAMNKGDILMPDLLQAGYHIGLDTIGQTLRNPNLQLRSDPLIPKSDIGPWNQSTIEPDIGRVPLEIGQ